MSRAWWARGPLQPSGPRSHSVLRGCWLVTGVGRRPVVGTRRQRLRVGRRYRSAGRFNFACRGEEALAFFVGVDLVGDFARRGRRVCAAQGCFVAHRCAFFDADRGARLASARERCGERGGLGARFNRLDLGATGAARGAVGFVTGVGRLPVIGTRRQRLRVGRRYRSAGRSTSPAEARRLLHSLSE